jgi:polar amino acid transport system substrate-binding protein
VEATDAVRADGAILLADPDFPPFSFQGRDGSIGGLAVDLALAACAEARVACSVSAVKFSDAPGALKGDSGDAIVSGPGLEAAVQSGAIATRPYFRSLARFAARDGSPLKGTDVRDLAGKRLGAVEGSAHAAWLQYYPRATVVTFKSEGAMQEALRTGTIDALFGDALHVIYWVAGGNSRGCCKLLGNAYIDRGYFSRDLVFVVRKDRDDLRKALDLGLDRLESKGFTSEIFNRYVPLNPW